MKIAYLFSGQGAQFPGMMKDLAEHCAAARDVFAAADKALGRSISDLCYEGAQDELNLTHNTQPCVLAADLAAWQALESYGIKPDMAAGFSLGEYGALVAADVISLEEVFPLIQKRADFMQEAVPVGQGAMAAVMRLSEDEVASLCSEVDGYVESANFNCPGQIVVSGESEAVSQLVKLAKQRKIRVMPLPVSAPFHCRLMDKAADNLRTELEKISFAKPSVPVFMNVDGLPENAAESMPEKLFRQTKSPVRWEDTLRNMRLEGVDTFVELGPGTTLSGFVRKTFPDENIRILNVGDIETLNNTVNALKGEPNHGEL